MALIDDFIKNEERKMSWGDKLFGFYPKIRSTPELTDTFQHLKLGNERVIKPSLWDKAVATFFLLFAVLFAFAFLLAACAAGDIFFGLGGFALMFILISYLFKHSFFGKKYMFNITVDYDGISVGSNKFYWTVIDEIYIMSKHEGKRTNHYLLIAKKDAPLEKFKLYTFSISPRKLSTIIEYYRTGQQVS